LHPYNVSADFGVSENSADISNVFPADFITLGKNSAGNVSFFFLFKNYNLKNLIK
jgi:hypothetical protein